MPTPTSTIPVPSVWVDESVVGRGCGEVVRSGKVRVRGVEVGVEEGVEDAGRGREEVEVIMESGKEWEGGIMALQG